MRRFAAMTAAAWVSNVCVIPSLLFTGADANPTAPLRCSMMNHFVIVSVRAIFEFYANGRNFRNSTE
jgi:hypothetical protein